MEQLQEWKTANRAALLGYPGTTWLGQILVLEDSSLSEPRGPVTGTLVTLSDVPTDSVASILSCFHTAGRPYCPFSTCRTGVQHEGHRSLAATGFTTGSTYSSLLYFKGGAGEQEAAPTPAAEGNTAVPIAGSLLHSSPLETRADEGGSSAQAVLNAGNTDERVRAEGDDNSTQAADGEVQRAAYAYFFIVVHIDNTLLGSGFAPINCSSVALASDLDKRWRRG